jgi:hypothetical protein
MKRATQKAAKDRPTRPVKASKTRKTSKTPKAQKAQKAQKVSRKKSPRAALVPAAPRVLALASGHQIEIEERSAGETLTIRSSGGQAMLSVRLTDAGPVVTLSGAALEIAAAGSLALRCDHFDVKAGSASIEVAGDLVERVGGDATRQATGTSTLAARSIGIDAAPGGVSIVANDDVDVKGERVRLNSEDPPMPLSWEEFQAAQQGAPKRLP